MLRAALPLLFVLSTTSHAAPLGINTDPNELAKAALGKQPGTAVVGVWRNNTANLGAAGEEADKALKQVFEIGSVSKVFTALLLAQSVERGELKLDAPIGPLLQSQTTLPPAVGAITLRQLVTHHACLPTFPESADNKNNPKDPFAGFTRERLWQSLAAQAMPRPAPCGHDYSNFGFAVLAELLSVRYGEPWQQLVERRITTPLGMHDTIVTPPGYAQRMPQAYMGSDKAGPWNLAAFSGAGGIRSTAADMLTFSRAIMAGARGPLGPSAARLLQPLDDKNGIAYAVSITGPEGRRTYAHGGRTGGFQSYWSIMPDEQKAVIVMASNANAPIGVVSNAVLEERYPEKQFAAFGGELRPEDYQGVFRINEKSAFTFVAQDGALYGRLTGQTFNKLEPVAEDTYRFAPVHADFIFAREDGKVASVLLQQHGNTLPARLTTEPAPQQAILASVNAETYGGKYKGSGPDKSSMVFDVQPRNGQLLLRLNAQPMLPAFPVPGQADRFAYEAVKAEVQFERKEGKPANAIILYQNGREFRLQRETESPSDAISDAMIPPARKVRAGAGGRWAGGSGLEGLRERGQAVFVDAAEQGRGLGIAHAGRRELARPFDPGRRGARFDHPQRGAVPRHRERRRQDRVAVAASGLVEGQQALDDRVTVRIRQRAHTPSFAQFTFRDVRQPVRQRIEAADQLPYHVRRSGDLNVCRCGSHDSSPLSRQYGVRIDQALLAQLLPERSRNLFSQRQAVFQDAFRTRCPRNHCRHRRIGQHELQCRRFHADAVTHSQCPDAIDFGQDFRRCLLVLEGRATSQNARAVGATDHQVRIVRSQRRHQALQRTLMIQQRVAARQQETVRLCFLQFENQLDRFDPVHTQAPGLDHALFAQLLQHAEGAGTGFFEPGQPFVAVEVLRHVVHIDHVEVIGAEAFQAVFDGTQRGRCGVIVDNLVGTAMFEQTAFLAQVTRFRILDFVQDQAADLGGQYIFITWPLGQRLAEADFSQAGAVERGGIEVADTFVPGRIDGGFRFRFRNIAEHIAQWGGAEADWVVADQFIFDAHDVNSFKLVQMIA